MVNQRIYYTLRGYLCWGAPLLVRHMSHDSEHNITREHTCTTVDE